MRFVYMVFVEIRLNQWFHNPNSVVGALMHGKLKSYWKNTGSYESLQTSYSCPNGKGRFLLWLLS